MLKSLNSAQAEEIISAELSVPSSFVRDVVRRLREAGRISSGRKATFTARELARIVIAMTASRAVSAVHSEMATGDLPRTAGDGAINAETELTDLFEQAGGLAGGDIDFRSGEALISEGRFVTIAARRFEGKPLVRTYKRANGPDIGMVRLALLPLPTIRRIATQIL